MKLVNKTDALGYSPSGQATITGVASVADLQSIITTRLEDKATATLIDGSRYIFNATATTGGVAPTYGAGRWWLLAPNGNGVNVKTYGAVGDGVTDDTTKIQAALTAVYNAGGGVLFFPAGSYLVTGTLTCYQNVVIIGEYINTTNEAFIGGTQILHVPTVANTDCLIVKRDPAGVNPGGYCDFAMRDIKIRSTSANSRDGVYLQKCRADLRQVFIYNFDKGLRVTGLINSLFTGVLCGSCTYGLYFDTGGTVCTTTTFNSCSFSDHTVCARIANANSVSFIGNCIFESSTQHAVEIDDAHVEFLMPYFEDIARECIIAGATTECNVISLFGGTFVDGGLNETKYAAISLDRVLIAKILPTEMRINKRALVQTTANTGALTFMQPTKTQVEDAALRANSTAYAVGDKMKVLCDDNVYRLFMCTVAGNTAAAQPAGYLSYHLAKVDGTATFASYGDIVAADWFDVVQLGFYQGATGQIMAHRIVPYYKGIGWGMQATSGWITGEFAIKRQGGAAANAEGWMVFYASPNDDKVGIRASELERLSATHGTMIGDGVEIINRVGDNRAPVLLTQRHPSAALAKMSGTSEAGSTKNISSFTAGNTIQGFVKININGTDRWMPFYDAPTA